MIPQKKLTRFRDFLIFPESRKEWIKFGIKRGIDLLLIWAVIWAFNHECVPRLKMICYNDTIENILNENINQTYTLEEMLNWNKNVTIPKISNVSVH